MHDVPSIVKTINIPYKSPQSQAQKQYSGLDLEEI